MKTISVLMPVYNEEKIWVEQSINSILKQTYNKLELIIILDNPKNIELENLIKEMSKIDNRIIFMKNSENLGLVKTLNKGLLIAKSPLIARMDADDIARKDRFEKQVNFLDNNKHIDMVGTNWICIDEEGKEIFKHSKLPSEFEFIKSNFKYNNMFLHPSWMFRREIINKINGYREITYCEDYDFISRLLTEDIKVSNINEYLMYYRVRSTSISLSRAYEQFLNSKKVIEYMNEREHNQKDSYNESQISIFDEINKEKFIKATEIFIDSRRDLRNKNYFKFIYKFAKSFLISRDRAKKNFNIIIYNIKLYTYLNK